MKLANTNRKKGIKSLYVAYGGGIGSGGISNFRKMAQAGGTNKDKIDKVFKAIADKIS